MDGRKSASAGTLFVQHFESFDHGGPHLHVAENPPSFSGPRQNNSELCCTVKKGGKKGKEKKKSPLFKNILILCSFLLHYIQQNISFLIHYSICAYCCNSCCFLLCQSGLVNQRDTAVFPGLKAGNIFCPVARIWWGSNFIFLA